MRRHTQLTETDCFRCCVASILGMEEVQAVPDWYEKVPPGDAVPEDIIVAMEEWFAKRGLALIETRFSDTDPDNVVKGVSYLHVGLPFILVGLGSRGQSHAAIYQSGGLWHDPSPPKDGSVPGIHARLINGTNCYFSVYMIGLNLGDPYWQANLIRNLVRDPR